MNFFLLLNNNNNICLTTQQRIERFLDLEAYEVSSDDSEEEDDNDEIMGDFISDSESPSVFSLPLLDTENDFQDAQNRLQALRERWAMVHHNSGRLGSSLLEVPSRVLIPTSSDPPLWTFTVQVST